MLPWALKYGVGLASQQTAALQSAAASGQETESGQSPAGQNQQTNPQNQPAPPETNQKPPAQQAPVTSPQNPPPSAQLPEPPIKNPEARPAPKPIVAPPTLTIPRLTHAPALEDFLEMQPKGETALQMAKVSGFVQRTPHDGESVSEETEAYLGYDQKNLYLVFVCFDDPTKVRARMSRREDIYDDDQVAVLFDTFHDRRRAYEFQTTPLGVQWDAIYTEATRAEVGGNWDTSFDTVWDSRGKVTSHGFVVWMAIPFKSLRFPATKQQEWGIILYRGINRKNEDSFWPNVSRKVEGRLGQAATLYGLEGISPGRDIELIPYGVMRGFRSLDTVDPYNPFFQKAAVQGQPGMDAKFVIRDHFVLDVTANPDFSQVESEDPQITVNQRFEVYFPEKRPFFLENEDYFRTPIDLFFTRNIQDPSAGIRLTGKEGPYSVGVMSTDDRAPGLAVPNFCPATLLNCSDSLTGIRSYFTIARVSRDIFKQSSVGAVYTDWECPTTGEYNRTGGLDTRLKFNANWTVEAQAVVSSSNLLGLHSSNLQSTCEYNLFPFSSGNAGKGNYYAGPADKVEVRRNGLHFNYIGTYQDISPGFVTVPGFVNRVDIRGIYNTAYYRFRPKKGWLLAWGPSVIQRYVFDHEGNRLDTSYDPYLRIEGRGQTHIWLDPYQELRERLRPQDFAFLGLSENKNQDYHEHVSSARFETGYLRKVTVGGGYSWGDGVNFVPAAHSQPQGLLSRSNTADGTLTFRPVKPLKIENTYLFERLRATDNEYLLALAQSPGVLIGKGILNNHILRSKWNWQFTPQLSLRVILQYNSILANTPGNTLYPYTYLPTQKQFNADFLVTYLVHPGTAIYVGYNSDLQNLDHSLMQDPAGLAGLYTPKGYINDSRQFFVKVSYLFRF
ncbi:MAG: carbohydrate binding family 9 domain-containing protein [Candidatus Sulfotelmatobacter sp.]